MGIDLVHDDVEKQLTRVSNRDVTHLRVKVVYLTGSSKRFCCVVGGRDDQEVSGEDAEADREVDRAAQVSQTQPRTRVRRSKIFSLP